MKWRNQILALLCLTIFIALGVLYFRHWVVQKPFGIVLFIGEGLTPNRVAATRLYAGGANAHLVIQAFERVKTSMPLLIVGDAPYAHDYIAGLKSTSDTRVLFPGALYGMDYRELQSHAYVYVHATEVGGTHPALIEAMGAGNCVIVYDTPENREVVGDCGLFFSSGVELINLLQKAIDSPQLVDSFREKAQARARKQYSWDAIADEYEALFRELCS